MSRDMDDAGTSDVHPALVDLVEFADADVTDPSVAEHVAGCPVCQATIAELGQPLGDVEIDLNEVAAVPSHIAEFFDAVVDRDPVRGDAWLLEWEGIASVGLVTRADSDRLWVVPATFDPPSDRAEVVQVSSDEAPFGLAFCLWPAAEFGVPLGVFSRPVGVVGEHVLAALKAVESMSTWDGALRQLELMRVGEQLAAAHWVPDVPTAAPVPLRDLLRARALRPSDVEARTRIQAADLTAMIQGRREATDSEAAELAELLDVSPSVVKRPVALPPALVRAIERPVHRAALRLRALRDQTSEALARLAVARSVLTMPARTAVTERDVETWDQLVRQYLDG